MVADRNLNDTGIYVNRELDDLYEMMDALEAYLKAVEELRDALQEVDEAKDYLERCLKF